ncbi:MAG: hypothetical protein EZS28_010345 [Streblomastix strix]|uniref:NTF2-related export protein n=1 Tax=Streblomastix strix TaxID=222440 RepID=A0A5J4WHG6_9EUKA|nr:MAG: hypothetical protein EZS28_010345 [Streblomastix strix]
MDITTTATKFVEYYYKVLDSENREALKSFYSSLQKPQEQKISFQLTPAVQIVSHMTFEGENVDGEDIFKMLNQLPKVQHTYEHLDVQSGLNNSILLNVMGEIKIEDQPVSVLFTETFFIMQKDNSWIITNQIFRFANAH